MEAPVAWNWNQLDLTSQVSKDPEVLAAEEEARLEAVREEAYLRGLEEGTSQGRTQARQELAASLAITRKAVDAMREIQDEWVANLEENLAAVAIAIAKQLVERELETDPDLLSTLIQNGVAHFPKDNKVRIRVNPRDLNAMSGAGGGDDLITGSHARWMADESIQPGSFILEGPERVLDGRVDSALERLYRSMVDG